MMPRHAHTSAEPYSVSYLFPAPAKVTTFSAKGHRHDEYPPEYLDRVKRVFAGLLNIRARAAFYNQYRQIIGQHDELEGLIYNAPPHWDNKTLTATEVDGTVIEKYRDPDATGE
jgi:hypothetical protein